MDALMGFTMGFYNPIQNRWRNKDCRARFMGMIQMFMLFTPLFDKPFAGTALPIITTSLLVT